MIQANFSAYASYVTDSLYQWDINQKLSVEGLNLSVVPEVHFSNATMDRAIVRQATVIDNIVYVDIPNSLLQMPFKITAHIGIYSGKTFKVIEKVEIPVKPKPRPADYHIEDSDEEIYSFKALENEIVNAKTDIENKLSKKADSTTVNARIDNIIVHNNDTEGNTELVDIRVGADGTIYDTAGNANRYQMIDRVAEIKRVKNSIIWESPNKFDPSTITKNKSIDYNTGEIIDDSTGKMVSDFIEIPFGETQILGSYITNAGVHQLQSFAVAYYDRDKQFITYHGQGNNYAIPQNAKYLRIMIAEIFATVYNRLMLEFGTEMSEFCEYGVVKLKDNVIVPPVLENDDFSILKLLFEGNKKIKLLGDSITQGVGGTNFEQDGDLILTANSNSWYVNTKGVCWANMFKTYVESKFPTCTVKNWGTRSESYCSLATSNVDKLSQLIEDDDDLIIMMFGTNDRDHSDSIINMLDYAREVIEYITITKGKPLILMTSLPASVNNESAKTFHLEDVDNVNTYLSNAYSLKHISVYREFIKRVTLTGGTIDEFLGDGLHPNDSGYEVMFDIIAEGLGIGLKRPGATW